ncbi:hypothetical protein OAU93_01470 [bacterium]|nr:hypothetical protein [bacterium]
MAAGLIASSHHQEELPLLDRFRTFLRKSLPDFHRFPSNSVESGEAEVRRDLS